MILLLLLPFLFGDFVEKWYIPQGVSGFGNTIMQIVDTDRDTHLEFIFTTYGSWPPYIYTYELHLPDIWQIDSIPLVGGDLLWDSGDFDDDGLYDLALQFHIESPSLADGIMIYESPDSFSYPTQEVWRDTVGFALVQPISTYDVDGDSHPEIFELGWRKEESITIYYPFGIYESIGNNQYDTIFMGTGLGSLSSTIAFGDFDADMFNEFVVGNIEGRYQIWECTGNNSYQEIILQQLSTGNITDCFAVPDADGDGKLEFVVKGFAASTARIHAFIFEATGNNTYEIIDTFDLFGGQYNYYGGYSDVGDVDGDGIPEIALEGCQNIYILKAAGNDSFYVWETLWGNNSGSSVRVFDIDGNGLSEVIISGNNQTRIYEYEVGVVEDLFVGLPRGAFEVQPNPFTDLLHIRFQRQCTEDINMDVYDVSGRLVNRLHQGVVEEHQTLTWQGEDENGRNVPQGIYFIRVECLDSGDILCQKVLKVK
jgi:hypothetical protein